MTKKTRPLMLQLIASGLVNRCPVNRQKWYQRVVVFVPSLAKKSPLTWNPPRKWPKHTRHVSIMAHCPLLMITQTPLLNAMLKEPMQVKMTRRFFAPVKELVMTRQQEPLYTLPKKLPKLPKMALITRESVWPLDF